MGTRNCLWHFILSASLCTVIALERGDTTTATTEIQVNVSRSTNDTRTDPAANSSNSSVAEPNTQTNNFLLGTTSLSPSMVREVGEGRMVTTPTTMSPLGMSAESTAVSPALPTAATGTTAPSTGTESGTPSSPPLSSAMTSHSSSSSSSSSSLSSSLSSSSSSPEGFPAVTPTSQQSSTSSTTEMFLATTSHPPTAQVFSTAGGTDVGSDTVATEEETPSTAPSTASTNPVPSASITSPASDTSAPSRSSTAGSSTETPEPQHTSGALTQEQPTVEVVTTSPPTGSPSPSTVTSSAGSSATIPPGEGESSTMNQGIRTPEPTASTSRSLPSTSLATPPTTNLSKSTSASPAFTGTRYTTTTNTTGTGSTTTAPPDTTTTNTTGTGSTTTAPPNTNTTSTTGTGSTTTAPPDTNTTSTTGTGSTTTAPPDTNTTSTTGTGSTTTAPPDTNTTSTTGTGSTTTAPPNTNTTSTTGTGSTTTAPPDTNTTSTTGTGSTTTAPADTNTTVFTGSTSSSVFTTSFTSPPCMTVSIEVQNVTEEEIQLSWTSISKASFYNISVKDGKKINTYTTNETKAVFKNLLPGHVYIISVAVSSCAENKPTSVIVRTDSASCFSRNDFCSAPSTGCSDLRGIVCSNQAFACSIRLKRQAFNNTLYNSGSEDYKTLSARIKTEVAEGMEAKLGNDHFSIVMLGFRHGSVIADFLFVLSKEEAMDVTDIQTYLREVLRSKFGNDTEVLTQPVQPSTDNSSSWRVAVIVLGVLLGVALVLILLAILFFIYVRRRSGMGFSTLYTW